MKTLPLPPPELQRKLKRQAEAQVRKEEKKLAQTFVEREYDDEAEFALWHDLIYKD